MPQIMIDIIDRRIRQCVMEYITTGVSQHQVHVILNDDKFDPSKVKEIFNQYKTLVFTETSYRDIKPMLVINFTIKNAKEFI